MTYIHYIDNNNKKGEVMVLHGWEVSKTERELEAKGFTITYLEKPFDIY